MAGHFFVRYNGRVSDSLLIAAFALQHNPWRARMTMTTATAVTGGAIIPFDTKTYDPAGMATTGVGAKFTILTDGYYMVESSVQNITTAVILYVDIQQNSVVAGYGSSGGSSGTGELSQAAVVIKCVAGDVITANVSATTTIQGAGVSHFSITWIAPA